MLYILIAVTVIVLNPLLNQCTAARLPAQWCAFVSQICGEFKDESPMPPTLLTFENCLQTLSRNMETRGPLMFFMPPIIIWSPLEQFSNLKETMCPKCQEVGKENTIFSSGWRDGTTGRRSEPRKLYGEKGIVLLVTRVYQCCKGHEVLGHDPVLLREIPLCFIPFRLWHITGFTTECAEWIYILMSAGISIHSVRNIILQRQTSWFYLQKVKQKLITPKNTDSNFPSFQEWQSLFSSSCPSVHAVSGCFLENFWRKESAYVQCMQKTSLPNNSNTWLSCDHTFASATNVGMGRGGDHRWITQYGALFCVLNSIGQVVTWKLSSGVSFAVIESHLMALKERFRLQGTKVTEFYVDNCCAWRNQLQRVFGRELKVYLDIFHAVKRVGEKIPKRHPLRGTCMDEWRMVFRDPSDIGKNRHKTTPAPDVLESNLLSFYQRWKHVNFNGRPVLNDAAAKEIENILKHMQKGCLSGIQPGRGTNRNESLHKNLNSIMSSSRYGVELAYALFTVCFFKHNQRMICSHEKQPEIPIEFYQNTFTDENLTAEKFGLNFILSEPSLAQCTSASCQSVPQRLDIRTSSYGDLIHRINGITQCHHFVKNHASTEGDDSIFCQDVLEDEDLQCDTTITVPVLKNLLLKALMWFYTYKDISRISDTARISVQAVPFMSKNLSCNLFDPAVDITANSSNLHEQRLDQVLLSWNFSRVSVPRDGDCLYFSIAYNLKQQVQTGNIALRNFLAQLGIPIESDIREIIMMLRKLTVEEWLGENSDEYQVFLTSDQLQRQALQFLESGQFAADIGDLVVTALSNILKCPIVLLTSAENMPIVVQHPTHAQMINITPVYVAFLQHGPGHYDAVIAREQQNQPSNGDVGGQQSEQNTSKDNHVLSDLTNKTPDPSCTCGKKDTKGIPCSFSLSRYTCRCPCYKAEKACNQTCRCKNCSNPFGTRPKVEAKRVAGKRKRQAHEQQNIPLRGKSSASFMKEVGESVKTGNFSDMEYLTVCSIAQSVIDEENYSHEALTDMDIANVHSTYTCIVKLCELLNMQLSIHPRTQEEVVKLLKRTLFRSEVSYQQSM